MAGFEGAGGAKVAEIRKSTALETLAYQQNDFFEAMEAIRDLVVHAPANEAFALSAKEAFRRSVREWNVVDSDAVIDEIKESVIESISETLDKALDAVEQSGDPSSLPDLTNLLMSVVPDKAKEISKCDGSQYWVYSWMRVARRRSRKRALLESLLVSAASAFEVQVGNVIRCHFSAIPAAMGQADRQYTFADVAKFGTIEEFEKSCIEDRVESIMRGDVASWFDWIDKRLQIKLADTTRHSDTIVEAFLRRNLIVHNAGIINGIYLAKTKEKIKRPSGSGSGSYSVRIRMDQEYILAVIDCLQVAGVILTTRVLQKIGTRDSRVFDTAGVSTCTASYEMLRDRRYGAVIDLSNCVGSIGAASSDLVIQVNKWIAMKEVDGIDSIREEVNRWDTSASSMRFLLAKYALLDDFVKASEIVDSILGTAELSESQWRNWPLLQGVREFREHRDEGVNVSSQIEKESPQK